VASDETWKRVGGLSRGSRGSEPAAFHPDMRILFFASPVILPDRGKRKRDGLVLGDFLTELTEFESGFCHRGADTEHSIQRMG